MTPRKKKPQPPRRRQLSLEPLERREMLSVSVAELALLQQQHEDLHLKADPAAYNIIELSAKDTTAAALQQALDMAAKTAQDDLIVVRTDADHSRIDLGDTMLAINVDSSQFGSVTVVALGTEKLQVQNRVPAGVVEIASGDVGFGGIIFFGAENASQEVADVFDLVQSASGVSVQTSQVVKVTENSNRPGNFSLFSEEIVGLADDIMEDGSLIGSKSYSVTVNVGGTLEAYLTGLTAAEKNYILSNSGSTGFLTGLTPFDAEKNGNGDTDLCWAGTSSNMLAYTGWGNVNGFQTEDDIFDYFRANMNDVGGRSFNGNEWFISGNYNGSATASQIANPGSGGFYPEYNFRTLAGDKTVSGAVDVTSLMDQLKNGSAAGFSVGWYDSNHKREGGHAISVWGTIYDTSKSPTSNDYYTAFFVSDPDNSKFQGVNAPNLLRSLAIEWVEAYEQYRFTTYSNGTGYLEGYNWLIPYTDTPPPEKADLTAGRYFNNWNKQVIVTTSTIDSMSDKKLADDAQAILPTDTVYIHYSVMNYGAIASSTPFTNTITLTGGNLSSPVVKTSTRNGGLSPRIYAYWCDLDFGQFAPGTYTLTLAIDTNNTIDEYDETDNTYVRTFVVVESTAPATPANFRATAVASTTATVAWNAVSSATGYEIRYRKATDSQWTTVSAASSATSYPLANLTAATDYVCEIRTKKDAEYSTWSSAVSIKTDDVYEPNDSFAQVDAAVRGGVNSPNLGAINGVKTLDNLVIVGATLGNQADYFRFELSNTAEAGSLAMIEFTHAQGDLDLYLYDASGTELARAYTTSSTESVSLAGLAAGVYYLKVEGFLGDANPTYRLTLDASYAAAPPLEVPAYSSLPGANHTIYLDFNGYVTTGTYWNSDYGAVITTPAFDLDDDTSSFSSVELEAIYATYCAVAEYFAPFEVNVTTVEPPQGALQKSGTGDTAWGIRVAIGGSDYDWYVTGSDIPLNDEIECDYLYYSPDSPERMTAGVAYRTSFNYSTDTPAFAFSRGLYDTFFSGSSFNASLFTQSLAETITHEVGHTLGLTHDGDTSTGDNYYNGHVITGSSPRTYWAPIMGSSYIGVRPLIQWSKGEYNYSNNFEDDLYMITTNNGFGYKPDTDGGLLNIGGTTQGIIQTSGDSDEFSFVMASAGAVSFTAKAGTEAYGKQVSSLYFKLEILDANNNVVAEQYASVGTQTATMDVGLAAGSYKIRITGVGYGDPMNGGFAAYGSIGSYSITNSLMPITEPGDVLATAMAMAFSGNTFTTTQRLGDGPYGLKDVDIYRFVVTAADVGKMFTFQTFQPVGGAAVDTYIRLFDAAGNFLVDNDDADYTGGNYYSLLEFTPTEAGTYYLGVSSFANRDYDPNVQADTRANGDPVTTP